MKRVCAWCKKEMGETDDKSDIITHGICPECESLLEFEPVKIRDSLDEFERPVLLIDDDARCLVSNNTASKTLEKELASIEGFLCGNIIGCVHAKEPGGCGKTKFCSDCELRNIIKDTFETGKSHLKKEVYLNIQTKKGIEKTQFFISTEKQGNKVLLRIDVSSFLK
ncbi:MAG: hypothetical protein U9Q34_01305 [Elusimicrobiota bacterium]|nr:hypothetical protein [Elusimicrobiota bacterium]